MMKIEKWSFWEMNEQNWKWRQRRRLQLGQRTGEPLCYSGQSLSLSSTLSSKWVSETHHPLHRRHHHHHQILLSPMRNKARGCMIKWNGIYRKMVRCSLNKARHLSHCHFQISSHSRMELYHLSSRLQTRLCELMCYISAQITLSLSREEVVKSVFSPYFENTIWYQDSNMYHFSMFHASHHIVSVPATEDEVEAEAAAVKAVANKLCPLEIVLDRVLLTSTGVLLGCWKVNSGDDPITIRSKLRSVLPRAPEKQLYDAAILHTSLARLLGPPISPTEAGSGDHLQVLHELVTKLNNQIRGFKALVSELWYVEEFDLLALALGGRMKVYHTIILVSLSSS
ncbi:uncharacterized protein LOC106404585 isoform X2 [Brassica napus]|uniref:uncharacterized protein LOC106404585 isoform X2 n=1 Tax=Brassica napus TaxID=3708 RepID=UPI0020797058|nr:uncharacterized protein LOC106404585 isoform X2 [Brassica napus]